MKIKLLFLVSLIISTLGANQNQYILNHDDLLDQRAQTKIMEIGDEVRLKLNVNLYVDIKENNGIDRKLPREKRIVLMKEEEKNMVFLFLPCSFLIKV